MPTNYDLTPDGSSTPTVRLYGDSVEPITRGQVQATKKFAVIAGADPASESVGLEPGEVMFAGYWLGAKAEDIAVRLRDKFLDDPSVTKVDLAGVDDSGNSVSTPYDGTYRLTKESTIDRPAPGSTGIWTYRLHLIEV